MNSMDEKGQRIIIESVVPNSDGVDVSISYGDEHFHGKAESGTDEHAQMLAAAKATIAAVNTMIPTPIITRVAEIQKVEFKSVKEYVVVILVGTKIRGKEVLFSGSARIDHGSPLCIAVRATLDAINRPIGLVL